MVNRAMMNKRSGAPGGGGDKIAESLSPSCPVVYYVKKGRHQTSGGNLLAVRTSDHKAGASLSSLMPNGR